MKTLSAEDFDFAALLVGEYGGEFGLSKDNDRVARIVTYLQQQAKGWKDREAVGDHQEAG